jgi:hypothetical protein
MSRAVDRQIKEALGDYEDRPLLLPAMADSEVSAACEASLCRDRELLHKYKRFVAGNRAQLAQLIRAAQS